MTALFGLLAGALFGAGLILSGMAQPHVVVGFLDVTGDWDPSLLFVMLSAIPIYALLFKKITGWNRPLFGSLFAVPTRRDIDRPLIVGAGLFGVGWGLGGFCPGPGLVGAGGFSSSALLFVATMVAGMALHRVLHEGSTK